MLNYEANFFSMAKLNFNKKFYVTIFIFKELLTTLGLRRLYGFGFFGGFDGAKSWFLCQEPYFAPFVAKYGAVVGGALILFD